MAVDKNLVSPHESTLFKLGLAFSGLVWVTLVVSVIGLAYGLLVGLFIAIGHALYLAHVRTNGVRVDAKQLPDLYAQVVAAARRVGLEDVPEVYIVDGHGVLNAFATSLFSRRYVVLFSDIVDACEDPRQLDFVIGHELGHFAAGHLRWNTFLLPFRLVPWLGPAYSRAREYTCDRYGHLAAGELEPALRGIVTLAAGGKVAARVDLDAFIAQRESSGGFWATVLELSSSYPFLCKRAAALKALHTPHLVRPIPRSTAGWLLAPVLGAGAQGGGGLVAVAVVGMLAAIAIPNFLRYQLRAQDGLARTRLSEIYRAELGIRERGGGYVPLELGSSPPSSSPAAFAAEQVEGAQQLGLTGLEGSRHVFSVSVGTSEDGEQAFAACAESDLDGDGRVAAWLIWEPLAGPDGALIGPQSPCRFGPVLERPAIFGPGDTAGVPTRVSPADVF